MYDDHPDDLDALFVATRPAPLPGLAGRARARLAALRRARRLTALLLVDLVACLSLVLLAYRFGVASQSSGLLPLLSAALADYRFALAEPLTLTTALIVAVPWSHVLALCANALLLTGLTSLLLGRAAALGRPDGGGARR